MSDAIIIILLIVLIGPVWLTVIGLLCWIWKKRKQHGTA